MYDLQEHYEEILKLPEHWIVEAVDVDEPRSTIIIHLSYTHHLIDCADCGRLCQVYDHRRARSWRHLPLLEYNSWLRCELPRTNCPDCGVKSCLIPWASPRVSYTTGFERLAVRTLLAARSTKEACGLLGCSWGVLAQIKARAVDRGLARRDESPVEYLALDEKHYGRGQRYATLAYDLDVGAVLEVGEGRTAEVTEDLLRGSLTKLQRSVVKAVAMDMWQPFALAVRRVLVGAAIVHDRFHIEAHFNKAIDQTRRAEHKKMMKEGDGRLTGTRYDWLRNFDSLAESAVARVGELLKAGLKVAKAWLLRQVFRTFWDCGSRREGEAFWKAFYSRAIRSRIEPVKRFAKMVHSHLANVLNYFEHPITTATPEGINSKIQTIQSNARGFRSFESLRVNILFYCGKLNLIPF